VSSTGLYSGLVKTAISVPDDTFARVERLARRLGISRSEFYARAAARLADELERPDLTEAIDRSLDQADDEDTGFTRAAAARLLGDDPSS
jgi:predicted transcriptional regulator